MFFFKIVLAIPDPLNFHMNFKISSLIFSKKPAEIFVEVALTLKINLGSLRS